MTVTSIAHITFIDPPICILCHTAEATVYARPHATPRYCYACAHTAPETAVYRVTFAPRCGCGEPATVRVGADATPRYCQACAYPTPDALLAAHAAAWWRDVEAENHVALVNATYEAYLAGGGTDAHDRANWRAASDAARLAVADPPPGMPDDDGSPDGGGPPNNRRPRCHCGAVATIWDEGHYCAAHYLELPAPQLFCPSCLCVAEQAGDGWRCASCGSVARLDELLTLSQLIERRESLAHIKVLVFARLACRNCGGPHRIQACPEIGAELFATEATPVVYDTLEMVRLWAVSRTLLVAKLAPLTRPQLLAQAVAFAAWLETRTHAGLKAASVLHIWEQMIEVDNGPVAPAMRVAA